MIEETDSTGGVIADYIYNPASWAGTGPVADYTQGSGDSSPKLYFLHADRRGESNSLRRRFFLA